MQIGICSDIQEEVDFLAKEMTECTSFQDGDEIVFYTPEDILFDIEEEQIRCDVLLLKVECIINEYNGIQLAEEVARIFPNKPIVFFSHVYDYVSDLYEVPHCYFIIYEKVHQYINKVYCCVKDKVKCQDSAMFEIIHQRRKKMILFDDVVFIRREQRQTVICTKEKEYVCYITLKKILSYNMTNFVRCHTGYIVNMDFVKGIEKNCLVLKNNEKIPVGRAYKKNIKMCGK